MPATLRSGALRTTNLVSRPRGAKWILGRRASKPFLRRRTGRKFRTYFPEGSEFRCARLGGLPVERTTADPDRGARQRTNGRGARSPPVGLPRRTIRRLPLPPLRRMSAAKLRSGRRNVAAAGRDAGQRRLRRLRKARRPLASETGQSAGSDKKRSA